MFDTDKIAARLQANVPNLQVEIIPGAGHALIQTVGRVLPFLGEPARMEA